MQILITPQKRHPRCTTSLRGQIARHCPCPQTQRTKPHHRPRRRRRRNRNPALRDRAGSAGLHQRRVFRYVLNTLLSGVNVAELTRPGPKRHRSFSPWTFTPGLTTSLYLNDPYNVATSNNHICIIPQIESVKGVANVEEIAAVEGVSALMFGPGDFTIDAGLDLGKALSGQPEAPFLEAMAKFWGGGGEA